MQHGRARLFAQHAELAYHVLVAVLRMALQQRFDAPVAASALFLRVSHVTTVDHHPVQIVPLLVQVTVRSRTRQSAQNPVDGFQQRIRFASTHVSVQHEHRTAVNIDAHYNNHNITVGTPCTSGYYKQVSTAA